MDRVVIYKHSTNLLFLRREHLNPDQSNMHFMHQNARPLRELSYFYNQRSFILRGNINLLTAKSSEMPF